MTHLPNGAAGSTTDNSLARIASALERIAKAMESRAHVYHTFELGSFQVQSGGGVVPAQGSGDGPGSGSGGGA